MNREYVRQRDDGYWIGDSRVSLDSIVYAFLRGASPESIARSFPLVTLEEIYGAITFYLAHQAEVDEYLRQGDAEFEALRRAARESNPLLYQKLDEARRLHDSPVGRPLSAPPRSLPRIDDEPRRTGDKAYSELVPDGSDCSNATSSNSPSPSSIAVARR